MEYKYYRELKHNYLIIKNEGADLQKNVSYQTKMLERGNLSGFIPCDLRTINNENYLYYEINSMQSIKDRFSVKGMSAADLKNLLLALKASLDGLTEYLLGMESVILNSRSVFVDLSTSEYRFMYCPFQTESADFSGFVDELFELVDHEDEAAVEMIYSFSEKMQNDSTLVLDCIDQVLGEDAENKNIQEPARMQISTGELPAYDEDPWEEDFEKEKADTAEEVDKSKKRKMDGRIQILFGFLFMGLLGAMMYIRMNYILSKVEDILSIIVIVLSMVTGLVAIIMGVRDLNFQVMHGHKKKEKEYLKENDEYPDCDFGESYENENLYNDDIVNEDGFKKQVRVTQGKAPVGKQDNFCGETVVLGYDEDDDKDIILYSRNTDRTIRIALDKLPLTIGKMEGCVDKVINDVSISRMHCRFIRGSKGGAAIVDLGSTNGTFRNGLKLNPQEECYIEEGDEIRIGKICFDCR